MLDDLCLTLSTRLDRARSELQRLRIERRDCVPQTVYDQAGINAESDGVLAEWARLDDAIAGQVEVCERQEQRLRSEATITTACKQFLHGLPTGARLRQVEARPDDLADVRERITRTQREIAKVERTPTPSDDIADRVKRHVDGLAAKALPIITGIGDGQALKVLYPLHEHADRVAQSGFSQHEGNALLLFALLDGEVLAKRLMETISDVSISSRERDQLLHALREQLTELRYAEEASICAAIERGDDVTRSGPPWAVLMIEIEQQQRAAA